MQLGIVLTATIRVQVANGNFSTEERRDMYSSTLRYYATSIGKRYPIIFLENSDYDLKEMKCEFEDKLDIEWIQLPPGSGVEYRQERGKGYNEYMMVKEGLKVSNKIKKCTHFLKITGRYAMINITTMIKEIENRAEDKLFMGDIKDTRIYEIIGSKNLGHWGDSRFFVANVQYYMENMADCYQEMNDATEDHWAEHYFLRLARTNRHDKRFIFRFRNQVQFDGVSGTISSAQLANGVGRQDSLRNRIKNEVRHILRIIFPNIWF